MPLNESTIKNLSDCVIHADDILHQVAMKHLLATGNPNRVKMVLLTATMLAFESLPEDENENRDEEINRLLSLLTPLIEGIKRDLPAGTMAFQRLAIANASIQQLVAQPEGAVTH